MDHHRPESSSYGGHFNRPHIIGTVQQLRPGTYSTVKPQPQPTMYQCPFTSSPINDDSPFDFFDESPGISGYGHNSSFHTEIEQSPSKYLGLKDPPNTQMTAKEAYEYYLRQFTVKAPTQKWIKENAKMLDIDIPSKLKGDDPRRYLAARLGEIWVGTVLPQATKRPMNTDTITPVRFKPCELNDDTWKSQLINEGVATIRLPFDVSEFKEGMWNFINSCQVYYGHDGRSSNDWTKESLQTLPHSVRGMFKTYGGHEEWLWKVREACIPIFSQIWETDELVCSYDGFSFMLPKKNPETVEGWFHSDAYVDHEDVLTSVQGVIFLTDSRACDPSFVYLEGSNKIFGKRQETYPSANMVWVPVDPEKDLVWKDLKRRKMMMRAGEILLFDSRLVHGTCPGLPPKHGEQPSYRMVAYVSMVPAKRLTPEERRKRREWYEEQRMTGHICDGQYLEPTPKSLRFSNKLTFPPPAHHSSYRELSPTRQMLIDGSTLYQDWNPRERSVEEQSIIDWGF